MLGVEVCLAAVLYPLKQAKGAACAGLCGCLSGCLCGCLSGCLCGCLFPRICGLASVCGTVS